MSVYDFSVKAQDGTMVDLTAYKGKVLLIVNTATGCGFTPQYSELQNLYDEFKESGLEILDFPCNQFGEQAPGSDEEIHTFCTGRFGITFPQFAKIDVNGENAIPLYKWLTENTMFEGFGKGPTGLMMSGLAKKMDKDYKNNGNVKWNFTKFLIDREGRIIARFEPTQMKELKEKLKECLASQRSNA
ncbi:MAG: glutathione peroxidase [Lachnospiraceae bacterium]|nr:glutathione peroxidase [Lachnospiraceae bacterium]